MVKYQSDIWNKTLYLYLVGMHFIFGRIHHPGIEMHHALPVEVQKENVLQEHNLAFKSSYLAPKITWSASEKVLYYNYEETAGCVWEDTDRSYFTSRNYRSKPELSKQHSLVLF